MSPALTFVLSVVAVTALFFLASSMSVAGRVARSLQPFLNRPVEIRIWGEPLADAGPITSVRALGAGLHLFVNRTHIKIAQPASVRIDERSVEIGAAKYVQCDGRNQPRVAEVPAVLITYTDRSG